MISQSTATYATGTRILSTAEDIKALRGESGVWLSHQHYQIMTAALSLCQLRLHQERSIITGLLWATSVNVVAVSYLCDLRKGALNFLGEFMMDQGSWWESGQDQMGRKDRRPPKDAISITWLIPTEARLGH